MSEGQPRSRTKIVVQGFIAVSLTGVALWFSLRGVDFDEAARRLSQTDSAAVILFCLGVLVMHALRVVRWGLLVTPRVEHPWRAILRAGNIGFPATLFLPLRMGEFVRPAIIARAGVPFSTGLTSVVVERVVDGLFNVGVFFVVLSWLPTATEVPQEVALGAEIATILFGGAVVGLMVVAIIGRRATAAIESLLEIGSPKLAAVVGGLLRGFLEGLRPLKRPSRVLAFFALTAAFWGVNGAVTTILIRSYGIEVPAFGGQFVVAVLVFAIMIPAGPAFVGPFQAGFRLSLAAFAVGPALALAVSTVAHLATIVLNAGILALGFLMPAASSDPINRVTDPPSMG